MTFLRVSNFLSIQSADIQFKRICVFIGPQAQGKSILVKLSYFFERLMQRVLADFVQGDVALEAFKKEELVQFEEIFPRYAWGQGDFSIEYGHGDLVVSVTRNGKRKNSPAVIGISASLSTELKSIRKDVGEKVSKYREQERYLSQTTLTRVTQEILDNSPCSAFVLSPVFIPASRSFFANIEKNIFSLLSAKFDIDPLLAEFGSILERTRTRLFRESSMSHRLKKGLAEVRTKDWKSIIHGDYVFDGNDERIEANGRKTLLAHSSSGQQEVIPLLLVLIYYRNRTAGPTKGTAYYIEEPEAHLFPEAQKVVAQLLARIANRRFNRLFITTHSPYILTAINNLALAGRVAARIPAEQLEAVEAIVPEGSIIAPGDLSAYRVNNGTASEIIDNKNGLINAYLVDQVSEQFSEEFEELMSLARKFRSSAPN